MRKALRRSSCVAAALAVLAGAGYVTASSAGAAKAPARADEQEHFYDAPTSLSAVKTVSGIELKWKSPQDRFNQLRVTESFETYPRGEYLDISPGHLSTRTAYPQLPESIRCPPARSMHGVSTEVKTTYSPEINRSALCTVQMLSKALTGLYRRC